MTRYQRKPKLYNLKFEDHPGFEIAMKGISIDGFMELARMAGKLSGTDLSQLSGEQLEEALKAVDKLFTRFARALRSWNLDDEDGQPVEATREGVGSQDLDFILEITLGWMDAIASVDTPLPRPANSPGTSQESSLQLASLSQSLSS